MSFQVVAHVGTPPNQWLLTIPLVDRQSFLCPADGHPRCFLFSCTVINNTAENIFAQARVLS